MVKIIESLRSLKADGQNYISFEFFPPKTSAGVNNLYTRMERMAVLEPAFVDVTWGAGGSTRDLTIEIAANAQKFCGVEVLMHLTCTDMTVDDIKDVLNKAKAAGIQNILALRGDPAKGGGWQQCKGGYGHSIDMVKLIRQEHGDYFGIAVAGHPEGHADSKGDRSRDIKYLKEKVDAGADFIITQLFYDVDLFLSWVHECWDAGIRCPILPGIMPVQNFRAFTRMCEFCSTSVPPQVSQALTNVKDDDEAVKAYGVTLASNMCKTIIQADTKGLVHGLHFYTLNLEKSVRLVLAGLRMDTGAARKKLPWRPSAEAKREKEAVRPIYWANRPKSYITRTESWDEYPNGRWGDSRSPAFGDLSSTRAGPLGSSCGTQSDRKAMWGESPLEQREVWEVFARYITGEVPRLPWCEASLHLETGTIRTQLERLNRLGFLTINSQPRVNGAPSDHQTFGWGGSGGYVYQKSYVEGFCPPKLLRTLMCAAEADTDAGIEGTISGDDGRLSRTFSTGGGLKGSLGGGEPLGLGGVESGGRRRSSSNSSNSSSSSDSSGSGSDSRRGGRSKRNRNGRGQFDNIMYCACDMQGNTYFKWNADKFGSRGATAVSWGVFPNKEVLQPTVVDPHAFLAWKNEAFQVCVVLYVLRKLYA